MHTVVPRHSLAYLLDLALLNAVHVELLLCRRCYEIRCANMVFTDNYNETIDRRFAV
jgi:hypothetical protein